MKTKEASQDTANSVMFGSFLSQYREFVKNLKDTLARPLLGNILVIFIHLTSL